MYPGVESVHVLGLCLFLGMAMLLDLRLLGVAMTDTPVSDFGNRILPWTIGGFALMVASGIPGRRAAVIASLRRPTAACSASDTSVSVRDTSVAVSMARSAMPGCGRSVGSIFTYCNSLWRAALAGQRLTS